MKKGILVLAALVIVAATLSSCSSVGTLGLVTRPSGDPGGIVKHSQSYKELGAVEGESCRYFLLAIIPWGDGTFSSAVTDALDKVKGDALINVTVTNNLYGFVPLYNIFSFTCTEVKGIAIKYDKK